MIDQHISVNRYKVIPRTLVFIFFSNEVLLIQKKAKRKSGFPKWNGVGGHIEKGEDPATAARREVQEETGIKPENLKIRFISLIESKEKLGICLFIFSATSPLRSVRETNEGKLKWFPMKDINPNIVYEDLPFLLDLVRNNNQEKLVKFLCYSYDNISRKLHIDVVD